MNRISNSRFRLKRFSHFLDLIRFIPSNGPLKILDIGGEEEYWEDKIDLLERHATITLLNIRNPPPTKPYIESIICDARCIRQIADNSFDVVHSNSVIEHAGRWEDMRAMASEIRRVAPAYFVQTPYYWFPVEPHYNAIFFHWLPDPIRARILMKTRLGPNPRMTSVGDAVTTLQSAILLDKTMMKFLFPDAEIIFERALGLPKSMMAIRRGAGAEISEVKSAVA